MRWTLRRAGWRPGSCWNELLQAGAELKNAFSNLNLLTGTFSMDTLFHPEAELRMEPRNFILVDLITAASEGRTDLVAALKNKEVAARALESSSPGAEYGCGFVYRRKP